MKLVVISDTHNTNLSKLNIPEGDVLIHCGDATGIGRLSEWKNFTKQWNKLPHKHKLFTPGNHDFLDLIEDEIIQMFDDRTTVLFDKEVVIDGIKFYGSPWCPMFGRWAWMKEGKDIKPYWDAIPNDVNVLITHSPPYGILDQNYNGEHCGCPFLLQRLDELKDLKLHVFGHIHESAGLTGYKYKTFVNAAIMDEKYKPENKPIVIEYESL